MNRKIMGVDIPLNELILLSFSLNDALITQLEFSDALNKSEFPRSHLAALRAIEIDKTPAQLNRWMVNGKAEYVGAYTKRLSKYVKKTYNINLDSTPMSILAEMLSKALNAVSEKIWIEFTDHADWKAGEFGDGGSCWWSSENKSRLGLVATGGGAIRIYTEDKTPRARLWYAPINGGDAAVLFNIKDSRDKFTMLGISRMLAMKYGVNYMRTYELHFPSSYIDGEGSAYQVGKNLVQRPITLTFAMPKIQVVTTSGFSMDDSGAPVKQVDPIHKCANCGDSIYEGDPSSRDFRGDRICEECAEGDDYTVCEDCECYVHADEYIYMENMQCTVCPDCYDNYARCEYCEDYVHNDDAQYVHDICMCESCRDERCTYCEDCYEYEKNDDTYCVEGERSVCSSCFEEYIKCTKCNEYYKEGTEVLNDDTEEWWCKECTDEHAHMCDDCNCIVAGEHDCPEAPPEEEEEKPNEEQP